MAKRRKKSGFTLGKALLTLGAGAFAYSIGKSIASGQEKEKANPETVYQPPTKQQLEIEKKLSSSLQEKSRKDAALSKEKGTSKEGKKVELQKLISPLSPPLRKPTPHGNFGDRRPTDVSKPVDHYHQGVDLAASSGERILAVGDGRIVDSNPGKGEVVRVLLLNDGRAVVYADLGTPMVEPGKDVKAGDVVATIKKHDPVAHTGGFVHVAIRESRFGKFLNPAGIIPFEEVKNV